MKYIYTMPFCSACIKLKDKYKKEGMDFSERDGERLKRVPVDRDHIDVEAMVVYSLQNNVFPVEVDINDNDSTEKRG